MTKPAPLKGRTWNPYTIPDVIDPGAVRCVKVYIPDSLQWLQIFAAVMDTMCHWKNYELMGDTTAAQCAALMRSINQQYNNFETCDECEQAIEELEYQMSICEQLRFNSAGVLQGYCCGEWVNIAGQPGQGLTGPGQPGGATGTLAPGACGNYHAVFDAKSQWLVPVVVNSGDVLTFSNATGAGTDGGVSGLWNCPNGQTFFAGACVGVAGPKAGDIAPSIEHMRMIAQINGVWYACNTGTLTVPGGVVNSQVVIQVNDSALSDNSGSYALDVQVCNNQSTTWTKTFDFTLSTQGWAQTPQVGPPVWGVGTWSPGVGWVNSDGYNTPSNESFRGVDITRSGIAAFELLSMSMVVSITKGTYFGAGEYGYGLLSSGGGTFTYVYTPNPSVTNGTNVTVPPGFLDNTLQTSLRAINNAGSKIGGISGLAGSSIIKSVTITGKGPQPTW